MRTEYKVEVKINVTTEFGIGIDLRTFKKCETPEKTFLYAWKCFPKKIDKKWFSVEFEQDGKSFILDRETFRESRFDFNTAVEIIEE